MYHIIDNPAKFAACGAIRDETSVRSQSEVESNRSDQWKVCLGRIAAGETRALAELYDHSSTIVFSLLLHIVQNRAEAEEMLNDVYDRVRQEAQQFSRVNVSAFAWLITLARNHAVEQLRRAANSKTVTFEPIQSKIHDRSAVLGQLTKEQRCIIQMTYFGGRTAAEVADLLGLSPEYVKQQIVLAMNTLVRMKRTLSAPPGNIDGLKFT